MYVKAITIVLIAMFVTIKPVRASPDIYYLEEYREGSRLITSRPSPPREKVTIGSGNRYTNTWLSDLFTEGKTIIEGSYNFRFWMDAQFDGINVNVTFTFGYYYGTQYYPKVTVGPSRFTLSKTPSSYGLSSQTVGRWDIPADSQLYLTVSIQNLGGGHVNFYYGSEDYMTHIETPTIVVPEFPMGVFLLPPMLLALCLILRRHFLKPL